MKHLHHIRLLLLPLLLLLSFVGKAQVYPVQVTVQAIPPYPIYLSDFTQGTSDRLRVQLLLTDVNVQNRRVRLKMSLNGGGINLSNPDVVEGALPINLAGGIPEYLTNTDLKPYFNPQNLPGLNPVAYSQPLPEGVYTLCFEAFDFITGETLSKKSCYTMALIQNDPPVLSMPRNNEGVSMQNPQSALFQWTPRHLNATNVSYEFTLLELLDTAISLQAAIQVMQPYYQTTTYSTSLWLGPADAPLTPGKKYVWRVRAKSLSGIDELGVFKNNGYSEAWSFNYTDGNCNAPMGLLVTDIAKRSLKVQWMPITPAFGQDASYSVSYRPRNGDDRWYDRQTTGTELTIFDLDPQTEYEFRAGRMCTGTGYVYGNSVYATTAALTDTNVTTTCGMPPAQVDVSNQNPLANLQSGETFTAGDFLVTAMQVSGAGGSYSGEGFIIVPYLANAKIRVKFKNIFINSDRKLAQGLVETTYDSTMSGITDLDPLTEGGSGTGGIVTGNVVTNYQTNFPIGGTDDIHITGPNDNPTITIANTTNGGGSGLTITPDSLPVSIADSNGDIYTVEPEGTNGGAPIVTKAGEQVPMQMLPSQLNQLAADKGKVLFAKATNTKYAFDAYKPEYGASVLWQDKYESLGNEYRVTAKAILPAQPDRVKALITIKDNSLNPDSLQFVTGKGTRYTSKHLSGNEYEVMLVGSAANDAQELYAVYPLPINTPADSGKYISLGKLLVAAYEPTTAKVVIVPVNGASVDSASIIASLNETYNGIGIKWDVQIADVWSDSTWDADHNGKLSVTGSNTWSVYTPEMTALNESYKASYSLVSGAAYLFVLPQAAEEGVAGDMPRGKRYGYLFTGSNGKTVSHELGHGVFALKHTFDNAYGFGKNAMGDNIMSYGGGSELSKLQWDAIHAPGLVIGVFEGDEDGQYSKAAHFALTPSGNIADEFYLKRGNKEQLINVTAIVSNTTYCITTIMYDSLNYDWDPDLKKYKNGSNLIIVRKVNKPINKVNLFKPIGDGCNYYYTLADWTDADAASANIGQAITSKISTATKWIVYPYSLQEPSCKENFLKDVAANNKQCEKNDIENGDVLLQQNLSVTDPGQLTDIVNSVCLISLRKLSYTNQLSLFKKIAVQESLKEKSEIALLRLMNALSTDNYATFFNDLEKENNKLIKHLVAEIDDKSIYPWDGDNYTNFIGALVTMFKNNPNAYLTRFAEPGNAQLLGQVFNLHTQPFKSEISANSFSGIVPINEFRFAGRYNENSGNVNVIREERLLAGGGGSLSTPGSGISIPIWAATDTVAADLPPLTPIVISAADNLPLVTTALEAGNDESGNIYVVPAIFLKFKGDKEFNDQAEKAGMITLDVVTIATSGAAALATKVTWARRLWAMVEVAGAMGNIGVNTGTIDANSNLGKAIGYYNTAMLIIGVKNIGKGVVKFAGSLPEATRNVLKNNGNLRNLLTEQYQKFKTAFSSAKNESDFANLDAVEKEKALTQERLFDDLMGVSGAGNWLTQRTSFWSDWINKCFPDKNWANTTFQTIGKDYNTFKSANTAIDNEMRMMYNAASDADNFLPGVINSGSTDPIKVVASQGEKFYKIVPKGNNINSPSPYYLNEAEYQWIKVNPSQLEQKLGLPLSSVNAEYDVFTITSKANNNPLFQSTIAPTKQFANVTPNVVYNTTGGRTQSLIINNGKTNLWEKSTAPIETINPNCLPQIEN